MSEEQLIKKLYEAVIACDRDEVVKVAEEIAKSNVDPIKALEEGLMKAAVAVGEKFDKMEIFLADLIMAGEAMKAGLEILLPKIKGKETVFKRGVVVCGTVKGDIHDIGKNILAALFVAHGFEVHDLGVDVPPQKFVEEAEKVNADIIAISALMTSTMGGQKDVIDYLKEMGLREKYIVMVGGGPVTKEWADEIGADGYAKTASEGVKLALELIKKKKRGV
ncbi:dimethylamine corrinoid protein 3 [Nanoarchaeota archaeon]|nr:MAG: dimethylamine corrinoid protein 3 [Nanoarchaeota archaeon]